MPVIILFKSTVTRAWGVRPSVRKTGYHAVITYAFFFCIAGCGGPHVGVNTRRGRGSELTGRQEQITPLSVKYLSPGVRTVIKVHVPGGFLVISAQRYKYRGKFYSSLSYESEPANNGSRPRRRRDSRGGGPSLTMEGSDIVEMRVSYGCVGRYAYTLAYGLLRNSANIVMARASGKTIILRKVMMPVEFHSDGVLVYSLLEQSPFELITQTHAGRILREENYAREHVSCS